MSTAVQVVVVGILLGLLYTLAGLGMTLSLGILKVLNLAHGMAIVAGCILAYELHSAWGVTPTISAVIAIPVLFAVGVVVHVVLVRRAQRASSESTLLVLFGAMLLLQAVAIQAWSGDSHSLTVSYSNSSVHLGSVVIRDDYLVAAVGALLLLALLYLALRFTMTGRAVQALAQHPDAARVLGIDVNRYASLVFGLSIAVAGASGALLADIFPFSVQSQTQWLAYAFIVVLVGGTGGVLNAAVGGLALGLGQAVFNQLIPETWVPVAVYGLLLVAMVARGGGLTAARERAL
jgi:branched-chain amino acid transport system permease protein